MARLGWQEQQLPVIRRQLLLSLRPQHSRTIRTPCRVSQAHYLIFLNTIRRNNSNHSTRDRSCLGRPTIT